MLRLSWRLEGKGAWRRHAAIRVSRIAPGQPESESREREPAEHVNQIMVSQVNRGEPEANSGNKVELETPRAMPPIKEEQEAGNRAMKAGKHIHFVAAARFTIAAFHFVIHQPVSGALNWPAMARYGPAAGTERVAEKTNPIDREQAAS